MKDSNCGILLQYFSNIEATEGSSPSLMTWEDSISYIGPA